MAQPTSFTHTQAGLARSANLLFNNGSAMGSSGGKLRLCGSAANYTNASTAISNEVGDASYPTGGFSLTVSSSAWNSGSNHHRVSFEDILFTPTSNLVFRYAVLTSQDDTLVGFWNWEDDEELVGGVQYPFQQLFYFTRGV